MAHSTERVSLYVLFLSLLQTLAGALCPLFQLFKTNRVCIALHELIDDVAFIYLNQASLFDFGNIQLLTCESLSTNGEPHDTVVKHVQSKKRTQATVTVDVSVIQNMTKQIGRGKFTTSSSRLSWPSLSLSNTLNIQHHHSSSKCEKTL